MSVLETFYFLFEGDASNLKKGLNESKSSTKQLEKEMTAADKVAQRLGDTFGSLVKRYGGLIAATFSAGALISGIKNAAEYAETLGRASEALNINVEKLDAWSNAATEAGGSAQGFQQTLKSLVNNDYFQWLARSLTGIKGRIYDATLAYPKLAELFEKLGKNKSTLLGNKMGLDEGTIMLLQKGRREVEEIIKQQKELGLVTKEDVEIATKFNKQWENTGHAFRSLFTMVNSWVLPVLTKIGEVFQNVALFFRRHSDLIKAGLVGIAAAITYFVLPAIATMVVAAAPFIALGAAIAAVIAFFALLYDDIKAFEEGNKSVIGYILQKWPIVADIFKGLGKIINWVLETILNIPNAIADVFNKVKSFLGLGDSDIHLTNAQKIVAATNTPIASQTSNSIFSSKLANKDTSVTTGPITITTQATDANGIAVDIGQSLETQIRQAMNNFDDGVEA